MKDGDFPDGVSVVLGTYNRLELLKRVVAAARESLNGEAIVHVSDAGSTDGTVEFLEQMRSSRLVPHLVGKKIGQAKALNDVFSQIKTRYVCWISDDNILLPGALDTAVDILRRHRRIGMVALKVKDVQGPFVDAPYIGGVSSIGVLNVNEGLLPTRVMHEMRGFSEEFRDYGIDPDLTARVLFGGYQVVYTRRVCIHHYRDWADDSDPERQKQIQEKQRRWKELYEGKYGALLPRSRFYEWKLRRWKRIEPRLLAAIREGKDPRAREKHRDCMNVMRSRCISILDPVLCAGRPYHLVQRPPRLTRPFSPVP